jgi:hypothetical protein
MRHRQLIHCDAQNDVDLICTNSNTTKTSPFKIRINESFPSHHFECFPPSNIAHAKNLYTPVNEL